MLFVSANNAGFARLLDDVDSVVTLPVRNILRAVRMVRAERCDVMVDFGAWPRLESLFTVMAHARCTVGMRTPGQHRHYAYDVVVDHDTGHEIDNYRRLIAAPGSSPPAPHRWGRIRPRSDRSPRRTWCCTSGRAGRTSRSARGRPIGGARWPRRSTPAASRSCSPAAPAMSRPPRRSWTHGAPSASASSRRRVRRPTRRWCGSGYASGVVSVNTGVMHLAAAVGVPVVALNGPTPVRRWGPVGSPSRSVVSPMIPDGYLNLGWEQDDRYRDAMSAITVDTVVTAWDDLMTEVDATPGKPPTEFLVAPASALRSRFGGHVPAAPIGGSRVTPER